MREVLFFGRICFDLSELGRETVSAYAAAKGGLKMLTRNICSEYGEYNIQCNGIGPGYIATPQTAPLRERQPDGSRHPFDSFICAKTPAGRWMIVARRPLLPMTLVRVSTILPFFSVPRSMFTCFAAAVLSCCSTTALLVIGTTVSNNATAIRRKSLVCILFRLLLSRRKSTPAILISSLQKYTKHFKIQALWH